MSRESACTRNATVDLTRPRCRETHERSCRTGSVRRRRGERRFCRAAALLATRVPVRQLTSSLSVTFSVIFPSECLYFTVYLVWRGFSRTSSSAFAAKASQSRSMVSGAAQGRGPRVPPSGSDDGTSHKTNGGLPPSSAAGEQGKWLPGLPGAGNQIIRSPDDGGWCMKVSVLRLLFVRVFAAYLPHAFQPSPPSSCSLRMSTSSICISTGLVPSLLPPA